MNTNENSSCFLSLVLPWAFSGSPLLLSSSSIYSHPLPLTLQAILFLAKEGTCPIITFSYYFLIMKIDFGGVWVFPWFRPVIQHSIWLTLGEKNLICGGDYYIGLCILLGVSLGKEAEKECIQLSKWLLLNGATFPWKDGFYGLPYNEPKLFFLNGRLIHVLLAPGRRPFLNLRLSSSGHDLRGRFRSTPFKVRFY